MREFEGHAVPSHAVDGRSDKGLETNEIRETFLCLRSESFGSVQLELDVLSPIIVCMEFQVGWITS